MGEVNLALNTIVYITIFIFPGILFRKFLFIRKDSKQFYFGNLFERFIWTLFFSLISLGVSALIFYLLRYKLEIPILKSISYDTVKNIYDQLVKNDLPPKKILKKIWVDYLYLLFAIYAISCILGFLLHFITNQFKSFGLFKHQNYWHDLFKGNDDFKESDSLTYGYTNADVLIETNSGDKLYSGTISDYFIDTAFKLQTIVLLDAKRYKKDNTNVEIKNVPGHHFILSSEKILNINLTYVYEHKDSTRYFKTIKNIVNTITLTLILSLVIFTTVVDIQIFNLTVFRKIILLIFGGLTLLQMNSLASCICTLQLSKIKIDTIYVFFSFLLPCLWVFRLFPFWVLLLLEFAMLIGFVLIFSKKIKKELENKNDFISDDLSNK